MKQILEEAADADAREDAEFGVRSRGDELPAELAGLSGLLCEVGVTTRLGVPGRDRSEARRA
jgi:hypothetical protein